MIHNGHLVHPDIWMLWYSFFGTVLNFVLIITLALNSLRRKP
jgi:hypothetical protein